MLDIYEYVYLRKLASVSNCLFEEAKMTKTIIANLKIAM